jgi:tyrosine-protein kinase
VDLRIALRVLREQWILIAVAVVLATATGAGLTWQQTPLYEARNSLYVSAWGTNGDTSSAYTGSLLSAQRVKSYTELLRGEQVMRAVTEQLRLKLTPTQLAAKVNATVVTDTVLLAVTATDTSPQVARDIANAVADQFIRLVPEFESFPDGKQVPVRVTVVNRANLPTTPASPQPVRNMTLAVFLGLAVGAALATARHTLDTTVKDVDQLLEISGAPLLGAVPFDAQTPKTPLILNDSPYAPRAEAFRKIRTNLQFVDLDRIRKVVLITSAVSNEGKSVTACNLAITAAEAGKRVLLVDADLRRPRAARYLGLPSGVGLTSVLVGAATVDVAIQPWGDLFSVLASGPIPPNPSELLGSSQMRRLLSQLRKQYDLVVIDGPPVLPVADAAAMASACDGAVLVVRHGKTRRDQVQDMVTTLKTVEANVLGTVFNVVPGRNAKGYYYYGYGPTALLERRDDGLAITSDRVEAEVS